MKARLVLLSTVAWCAFSLPAFADDADIVKRLDAMQKMLEAQQRQIEQQKSQIETQSKEIVSLRHSLAKSPPAAVAQSDTRPAPAQVLLSAGRSRRGPPPVCVA